MTDRNPWKISALISACYEFVLAMFLLFQMVFALLVLELTKYLPVVRTCSCGTRRHHNLFCSGHFPPFSPCHERSTGRRVGISGTVRTPTRFSRGVRPGRSTSESLSTSRDLGDHVPPSERTGFSSQSPSLSMSSVYKRKGRQLDDNVSSTQECLGSVDGDACRCLISDIDLYDDLIEVSSEYLKQKDRGHEEVILSLLKSLQVERRNLRALYEELEEERVAAETAANEAMGMILRLQEEKAALQMEADHYQRMAGEKALHDEHAIQLLEEDLCQKESERLLLEEELRLLRERSFGNDLDGAENTDSTSCCSKVSRPLLLLTGIDEGSPQEEDEEEESVVNHQDTVEQKFIPATCVSSNEVSEVILREDQPLKRFKSLTLRDNLNSKDSNVSDHSAEGLQIDSSMHSENALNEEDDAKSILIQLSALEKQLLALEEAERLHQSQVLEDYIMCKLSKPDGSNVINPEVKDGNADISMRGNDARASEIESSHVFDEEKVVNVDVANVDDGAYRNIQVPLAEDILDIHEGKRSTSKVVLWEACEEEKHLDMPSFVPTSNLSNTAIAAGTYEETCKPDVQFLHGRSPAMWEQEKWNAKRVTLEDINLRLQALENENTLLRHRTVPSNHEHMNAVFLKEIMQELQELLKANKNVCVTNEGSPSLSAYVKGEQHKKRHYSDGPGQFT